VRLVPGQYKLIHGISPGALQAKQPSAHLAQLGGPST
jgi:hypothetical protein